MITNTIVDGDGVVISRRVHREDIASLRLQRLIVRHKRREFIWIARVSPEAIRAALQPTAKNSPVAEANRTHTREHFSNDKGSGWLYSHHNRHCFTYATTAACAVEREMRRQRISPGRAS